MHCVVAWSLSNRAPGYQEFDAGVILIIRCSALPSRRPSLFKIHGISHLILLAWQSYSFRMLLNNRGLATILIKLIDSCWAHLLNDHPRILIRFTPLGLHSSSRKSTDICLQEIEIKRSVIWLVIIVIHVLLSTSPLVIIVFFVFILPIRLINTGSLLKLPSIH